MSADTTRRLDDSDAEERRFLSLSRSERRPFRYLKTIILGLLAASLSAAAAEPAFWSWAKTPPMGWNSWDCYGAGVWESNVIANADYLAQHLKPHGWDIITNENHQLTRGGPLPGPA
ncbi:MAG: hypothetical protein ACLQM8_21400 [Limisphaerales bacterium]